MRIGVINGPNLNLLGKREPEIYGSETLSDLINSLRAAYPEVEVIDYQSNIEGEMIDKLQTFDGAVQGIILNAGGFTHTSVALRDAIQAIGTKVIEVHLSNVYAREEFRQVSLIGGVCAGVITGFGADSYHLAMDYFLKQR